MALGKTPQPQKSFQWTAIGSEHSILELGKYYGKMTLQYEAGRIVLLRFEQTKKP